MPRIARSLIAAVLVSCLAQGVPVRSDEGSSRGLGEWQRHPPSGAPHNSPASIVLPATPGGVAAEATLARQRLPLWLVRRSAEGTSSAAPLAADQAIPIPPAKQPVNGRERQPLERMATARGHITSVVLSSLAIVLGLFFFVVWLARRAFPKSSATLPSDVLEVLGRSPMASRHNLQLIRLGKRLLLVSVTSDGARTLTEITDSDEVNHLLGLCRENQPGSIAGTFRQVLHQLGTPQGGRSRASRTVARDQEFTVSSQARHG